MGWTMENYEALLTGIFLGIAYYNCLELFIFIFHTFRRNAGLYFWSMLLTNIGILTHAIGVMLTIVIVDSGCPISVVVTCGWLVVVVGQSVVLYSRLHLVVDESRKILWILVMVISVALLVETPAAAVFIEASVETPAIPLIGSLADFCLRVQTLAATLQDGIISGL
jgi:hypothetical protein